MNDPTITFEPVPKPVGANGVDYRCVDPQHPLRIVVRDEKGRISFMHEGTRVEIARLFPECDVPDPNDLARGLAKEEDSSWCDFECANRLQQDIG